MMRGLVFVGGEAPDREVCRRLAEEADLIVAADSGLICAENSGISPDWIVGDMDSVGGESRIAAYPPGRVLRFPTYKDFTDTELAIDLLWEKGCGAVTIAGGGGGRLDHTLAIAALFEREKAPSRWFTKNEKIFLVSGEFNYHAKINAIISVFPLGDGPWKARSSGLKWPLEPVSWRRGFFGISNAAETETVAVKALSGRFMLIMNLLSPESGVSAGS
jgi:thiamine pyrophosphokinase